MTNSKKILIIDDEPKIIKALCDAFRFEEGFSIEGFTDGAEAIKRLNAGAAPDLVILDWRLKGEIQGRDIISFIKDNMSELPVWVVTASIHFLEEIKSFTPAASFLKPCADLKDKITLFYK